MDKVTMIHIAMVVAKIMILLVILLTALAYYGLAERRFAGFMQMRVGPSRCGPFGLLQPLADGVKFILKEDVIPNHVDKALYFIAPLISFLPALTTIAVVPFAEPVAAGTLLGRAHNGFQFQIADVNVGILYVFALASLGIYGLVLGGWASNNKYSLLGSLRGSAQMISYELSMSLSVIGILMVFETLRMNSMIEAQSGYISWLPFIPKWGVVVQPLGFIIFLVASFAETNRMPFDLPECEAEIVAGYHTEYGSMKFALFMLAEYGHMITASAIITCMFFGGWLLPWVDMSQWETLYRVLAQIAVFCVKMGFFMFFYIWVRWTLPRFRYDQLMKLGWKGLLPLSLLNILLTGAYYMFKYTVVAH